MLDNAPPTIGRTTAVSASESAGDSALSLSGSSSSSSRSQSQLPCSTSSTSSSWDSLGFSEDVDRSERNNASITSPRVARTMLATFLLFSGAVPFPEASVIRTATDVGGGIFLLLPSSLSSLSSSLSLSSLLLPVAIPNSVCWSWFEKVPSKDDESSSPGTRVPMKDTCLTTTEFFSTSSSSVSSVRYSPCCIPNRINRWKPLWMASLVSSRVVLLSFAAMPVVLR
mmetsp:Transcript_2634/g.6196  ORF Transcript_2634/g.6196 Transcript_2634/m.6196 type:complete len:226 (-) Transcript_2634:41-718(-)